MQKNWIPLKETPFRRSLNCNATIPILLLLLLLPLPSTVLTITTINHHNNNKNCTSGLCLPNPLLILLLTRFKNSHIGSYLSKNLLGSFLRVSRVQFSICSCQIFTYVRLLAFKFQFFFLNGLFGCHFERFYFSLSTQLLKNVNTYISFLHLISG